MKIFSEGQFGHYSFSTEESYERALNFRRDQICEALDPKRALVVDSESL